MSGFKDIIGNKEIKERLCNIISEFKNSNESNKFRSVLFLGPIGKTLFSNALINELRFVTFKIKGNSLNAKRILKYSKNDDNIIIFIDNYYDYKVKMKLKEFVNSIKNNKELRVKNIFLISTYSDNEYGDIATHFEENFETCFDDVIYLSEKLDHEYFEEIIKYYIQNCHVDPSINIDDLEGIFINNPLRNIYDTLNNAFSNNKSKNNKYISIEDITKEYIKEDKSYFLNKYHECEFASACLVTIGEVLKEGSSLFVSSKTQYYNSSLEEFNKLVDYPGLDYPGLVEIIDFLDGDLSDIENVYNEFIDLKFDKFIEITSNIVECDTLNVLKDENRLHKDLYHMIIDDFFDSDEEKKKWLELTQEILRNNKDFFFKVYDELIKNGYLFKSDIKRIRDEIKIIPYKKEGNNE